MRQRLSWTQKKADPYTMNQQHANNPVEKYHTYDTSTGKEDPDMQHRWEQEGRTETGHPAPAGEQNVAAPDAGPAPMAPAAPAAPAPAAPAAPAPAPSAPAPMASAPAQDANPARDAVLAARKLEDKALKCITIAQRMLPGASDDLIEVQATDLMYMPERCILATLQRQVELAQVLAAGDDDDKDKDKDKDKPAPAVPAGPAAPAAPVVAAVPAEPPKKDAPAPKKEDAPAVPAAPAAPAAPVVAAAPAEPPKKDDVPAAPKKEDAPAAPVAPAQGADACMASIKTASDGDLLDILFANEEPKQGAAKLTGIVKQASVSSDNDLAALWDAPPDVSKAFR